MTMASKTDIYGKFENIACKYLRHRIRERAREWVSNRLSVPFITPLLTVFGGLVGLVMDIAIPVFVLSGLSLTGIGIPIALVLLVALFTATCD